MLSVAIPAVEILAVRLFTIFLIYLIYSPDGSNGYDSRGGKVEGIRSV